MTYIEDLAKIIKKIVFKKKNYKQINGNINSNIFNIGNSKPIKLKEMINFLENSLKLKAKKKFISKQPGEMLDTLSDSIKLKKEFNIQTKTSFKIGLEKFVTWFLNYYKYRTRN